MRYLLTAIFVLLASSVFGQFKGLIVNEFSQGNTGSREYIELLVVGKRTCNDSTADLRGWIVDDQNGWYGNTNSADGHYRFKDIAHWSAVPYGSIILLYNSASGEKNLSIAAGDDPTDANKDYAYILPINSSAYLEEHDNEPTNILGPTYAYPSAALTTGYNGASDTWVAHIALNNTGGDVLSVVSRTKRDSAFFSIGYGYAIAPGFRVPTITIADVPGGNSVGLVDSNYLMASKWNTAAVPSFETPGLPNGSVNTSWIQAMRTQATPLATYTTACSNGPYLFFNQTITSSGSYRVLTNNSNGCVDTNDLYVVIKRSDVIDLTGCDSLVYKGVTYRNNTTIVDNINSVVIDCDSIVRTVHIRINKSSSSLWKVCMQVGQSYVFNNQAITSSGAYPYTLRNSKGCDSIARLQIVFKTLKIDTIKGCKQAVHNGVTYTSSAVVHDTTKSIMVAGCDSVIRQTHIIINSSKTSFINACTNDGNTYNFNGQQLTTSGVYTATLQTSANCDSTVNLYIVFKKTNTQNFTGCDSVSVNGTVYYQPTILQDTIKSFVTGCDSIIAIKNIVVNNNRKTYVTVCTSNNNYLFYGQTVTANGFYTHNLSTTAGCDSLIQLYIVLTKTQTQNLSGCGTIIFNGISYTLSTTINDTIRSLVTGCDSIIRVVNIQISNTADLQTSADITVCKGDVITLSAASSAGTISWLGFGTIDSITVAPSSTTMYTVIASNGSNCTNTKTVTVSVEDFGLNVFTSSAPVLPGTTMLVQTTANFPYVVRKWEPSTFFANQNLKTQQIIVDSSINLFAVGQSSTGCKDTAYLSINVTPLDDIYIPSGFTPNGDGKNEVVRVIGQGIKELDFKVFNRWGQLVFATTEKGRGWDGRLSGKPQPAGTYVYAVRIKMNSGQIKEKKGTLILIR